jgi:hypothetical protein
MNEPERANIPVPVTPADPHDYTPSAMNHKFIAAARQLRSVYLDLYMACGRMANREGLVVIDEDFKRAMYALLIKRYHTSASLDEALDFLVGLKGNIGLEVVPNDQNLNLYRVHPYPFAGAADTR